MSIKTAYYLLDDDHSAQEWGTLIATLAQANKVGEQVVERTYLDTFDWSFCRAGVTLSTDHKDGFLLNWATKDTLDILPINSIPKWATDLPVGSMRKQVADLLDLRALLPLAKVHSEQILLAVEDKKGRTRVRLSIECNFQRPAPRRKMIEMGCLLKVECLAGYEKDFAKVLPRFDGLKKSSPYTLFESLILNTGRAPKDYASKMKLSLKRDMRSDEACKTILLNQLEQIERNIDGTKANTDIEFLHDLRVSVRRSRSALSRLKGVLPTTIQERFSQELAWIGSITTPVRDLDVYMVDYPKYRDQLRHDLHNDLLPLYDFLVAQHSNARKQLLIDMESKRFKDFLMKWRDYLERPLPLRPTAPMANFAIGEIADKRIWKTYRRVITDGSAITGSTPAESLHDLRKTCKKLRYLLEFFASLYPAKDVGALIKTLKGLQENLGDFQDLDVQAETLHDFSIQMMDQNKAGPKTYMAMGVLVEKFMIRKDDVRSEFEERFKSFSSKEVEASFRKLVGKEKRKKVVIPTIAKAQ